MKKTFLILTALLFLQFGCRSNAANDSNTAAANTAPAANQNANIAAPEETPLPTFTDAAEALAEGKKLIENLDTQKAVEALKQAVALDPDLAEAYFNLGIAYSLIENDEEKSVEPTPAPSPTPAKKQKKDAPPVRTKNSEKAFENAVKAYKKILAKNPKDDVAQYNLGRSLNKLNEDEDAMKALKEAVKLKPDDTEYQTEYGAILIKLAQYDEAVVALKKAVSLDESNLLADELLEKAEAGKKRIDFGLKPKLPPQEQQEQTRPPRRNPKPAANDNNDTKQTTNTVPKPNPSPKKSEANKL